MGGVNRHGTHAGWAAHQRNSERPCDPCYQAKAEYDKRNRDIPANIQKNRITSRAQGLATRDLIRWYGAEYSYLYKKHKRDLLIDAGLIDE